MTSRSMSRRTPNGTTLRLASVEWMSHKCRSWAVSPSKRTSVDNRRRAGDQGHLRSAGGGQPLVFGNAYR